MVRPADEYSWKEYCRLGQQAPAMNKRDEKKKTTLLTEPDSKIYKDILEDQPFFTPEEAQKLFDEFDIKQDWEELGNIFYAAIKWRRLAERLAEKYHPDFEAKKGVGRPKHKTGGYYAMLLGTVNWFREKEGFSNDRDALKYCYNHCPHLLVGTHNKGWVPTEDSLYRDLNKAKKAVKEGKFGKLAKHPLDV